MRKMVWIGLGAALLAGGVVLFSRRGGVLPFAGFRKGRHKPMTKDVAGNYDIDGVSYDLREEEVVVSGDFIRDDEFRHHRHRLPER